MAIILGIGNTLLQDEGMGIHLLKYIQVHFPQWQSHHKIEMVDGGTLSFDLLSLIQYDQELIVLDAINNNQIPGSVFHFTSKEMDKFLSQPGKSVHEVSLMDLFDMSRLSEQLPEKRAMVGIQPDIIDWGEQLTPIVFNSLPKAAEKVEQILQQWKLI